MSDIWVIYNQLVRAKNILGQSRRFAPQEELNDVIDEAFGILDGDLPLLAEAIEELESEE